MTPREQLRKMTSLGEQGTLEEKHWYRLVNGMSAGELRQRQEMMMRNQMAMAPQILAQGAQRLQGGHAQFEPRFMEREMGPPSEMVSSEARQMHLGAHLGPPMPPHASGMPGRGFPGAGYRFLPSEPMETVARRQELIHKQNIARMEMNAILHQKELESAQQKGLLGLDPALMYPSNAMAFSRGRQRLPDGPHHDLFVHRTTLDDLQHNSLLMSPSSPAPYPPIASLQRERGRRGGAGRRAAANHKSAESQASSQGPKGQSEDGKGAERSPGATSGEGEEKEGAEGGKGGDAAGDGGKTHPAAKMDAELAAAAGGRRKSYKEAEPGLRKSQDGCHEGPDCHGGAGDKGVAGQCSAFQEKFLYPSPGGPMAGLPFMFPAPGNGLFPPGPPSLFLNGDDMSSLEDIRKWTVEDVSTFILNIPSCSEYAQTFKEHMIDGETLPLLTEEHLLDTLGLKLGPALKIRSQVSRRLGNMLYMMNLPLPGHAPQPAPEKAGGRLSEVGSPAPCLGAEEMMVGSPGARDTEVLKAAEPPPETEPLTPPCAGADAV